MNSEDKLLETYKGVHLWYDVHNGRIKFNFEDSDRETHYLFEAYDIIDAPRWKPCEEKGYTIDGVFADELLQVRATKRDLKSGRPLWKYFNGYEKGKQIDDWRTTRTVFPATPHNDATYNSYLIQKEVIQSEKLKLANIIKELKHDQPTKK